jgi:hypothetical protein
MTYSQITTDVSPDSPAETSAPHSDTGYANGQRPPGGNGFRRGGARHVLARVEELGGSASWVTWAILGSAVAALASFRPLIHQTSTDTIAHFQIKNGVTHVLWVPRTSSTSCDQVIFADQASDASLSCYAVLLKVDRFGWRFQWGGAVQ